MKWTSLGSDIWQQPQVLAPLNLNPELFLKLAFPLEPETSLALTWAGLALSEGHWHTLTLLPTPGLREEHLFPPVGKTDVVLLSFLCPAEFFYRERGKGKISFLPIFLLPIAKVDLPLFSTCHVSSYSFPLPVPGDHGWQLAKPPVFCWWLFQTAWAEQDKHLVNGLVLIFETIVPFCKTAREASFMHPIHF